MSGSDNRQQLNEPKKPSRISSLDQFRGFTVVGMLLVNYFGDYAACPQLLKHSNDYCSFADTIMPQFLFAVGFALRLSFGRRMQSQGSAAAYGRMIRRLLGLVLLSLVIYNVDPRAASWEQFKELRWVEIFGVPMKRDWFQTLMHIAVTSLWLLPVVHRGARVRIAWMVGSAMLHVALSAWFNFAWIHTAPMAIDGGPLGFLTWSIAAVVGTLACDYFVPSAQESSAKHDRARVIRISLAVACGLMLVGYALSCGTRLYDIKPNAAQAPDAGKRLVDDPVWPSAERWQAKVAEAGLMDWLAEPPFVKPPPRVGVAPNFAARSWNYWMMSQRAGSVSYLTFAAGFSLLVFCLFCFICDVWRLQLPLFRTFGTNALVAYVLHVLIAGAVQPFFPADSPLGFAVGGLLLYFLITWLFVKQLEKQGAYLRV